MSINMNELLNFALRWLFAGFWGAIGWALAAKFILPLIP